MPISIFFEHWMVLGLVFVAVFWLAKVITPILAQAGYERSETSYIRSKEASYNPIYRFTTPERLLQVSWSTAVVAGGLVGAALIGLNVLNEYILLAACLLAGGVVFQVPRMWVNHKIKHRQQLFEARLLDLILGLASGLRSGAALPQCMEMIVREMTGPIQEEFTFVLQEYRLGVDLPEALTRLTRRMPGEDVYLLTTAIRLTMLSGGSLSEVLDRIGETIRNRTEFYEKLRTLTAQGNFEAIAMASAPAAAFVIIGVVDKQLMLPLVTTAMGWAAIGAVVVLEIVGFIFIKQIVTVKV